MAKLIDEADGSVLARVEQVDGRLVVLGPEGEPVMGEGDDPWGVLEELVLPPEQSPPNLLADSDDINLPLPKLKPGEPPEDGAMIRRGHLRFERVVNLWVTHLPPEQAARDDWPSAVEMVKAAREERHDRLDEVLR